MCIALVEQQDKSMIANYVVSDMWCQLVHYMLCKFHKIVEVDELRQVVQTSSETNNTDAFNDVQSNAL